MEYLFEILDEETAHDGFLGLKRYRLRHECYSGGMGPVVERERIEGYEAASVLLYDPRGDRLVMIEQFRIGAIGYQKTPWVLEIVGGLIEAGQTPESVARREAVEEAGCATGRIESICDFMVSPGFSTERIHLFCAEVDARGAGGVHGLAEEGEDIRVEVLDADQAIAELYGG
ncbi:MAG: ADP-ribose pyrophosphatase, partial [Candidatus Sedimenticola endophacoides]